VAPELKRQGFEPSIWLAVARREKDLGPLLCDPAWREAGGGVRAWRDDHADLLRAWRWRRPPGRDEP
jgi:hypothetical protein